MTLWVYPLALAFTGVLWKTCLAQRQAVFFGLRRESAFRRLFCWNLGADIMAAKIRRVVARWDREVLYVMPE